MRFFRPKTETPSLPAPGLYHYERRETAGRSRSHLRVDSDGHGTLVVDAARILHLNPTAAQMAYLALEGTAPEAAARTLAGEYRIPRWRARADFAEIAAQVDALTRPGGPCPVCDMELDIRAPFSHTPSAPYRMDLALTYRCQNDCAHCYNARPRTFPELPAADWRRMIDRLWDLGIPHVVFTGGEPTLREDLAELVAYAERKGQITGLNTNGRRLADREFLNSLVDAGLDHVQITLESSSEAVHDSVVGKRGAWAQTAAGLRNALETRLFVMTNTTLLRANTPTLEATLEWLAEMRVPTVGLNGLIHSGRGATVGTGLQEEELAPLLAIARRFTDAAGQRLIWYTPTAYCRLDPVQSGLGVKGCTAALYNMCVEPDGGVLPCQSYYHPLGNLLRDEWPAIWNHDLARSLRERRNVPAKCKSCILLAECGGGCPLQFENRGPEES
ncbi:MAG: radical SAM protein [Anaerolineales bacterium]|nr:radical SAM protein [Anaerolineales bacterium]